jgi:hypothetical protein
MMSKTTIKCPPTCANGRCGWSLTPGSARVALAGDPVGRGEDRLHTADPERGGQEGRGQRRQEGGRGLSYGDTLDLANPDDKERGLLGNFIGASLGAQFEAVICDWLNLGLHSPEITGSNDPLLGANTPETSWFDLNLWKDDDQAAMEKHRIYGLPRFVTTRGGAYTFLPEPPRQRR